MKFGVGAKPREKRSRGYDCSRVPCMCPVAVQHERGPRTSTVRRQLQGLCYAKADRSASNSPPLDLTPKRSSPECSSTTCSTPPDRYAADSHLYLSAFRPQQVRASDGVRKRGRHSPGEVTLFTPQMSMTPRFVNTHARLTQAVYETAASILVTVSTVKSFPALMTLPFVDQVIIPPLNS